MERVLPWVLGVCVWGIGYPHDTEGTLAWAQLSAYDCKYFFVLNHYVKTTSKQCFLFFFVGRYLLEGPPSIGVLFRGTSFNFLWIVFILLYNFLIFFSFLFLATLHNLGYLSSLTRNRTQVAFSGSTNSKPLVSQGISCFHFKSGLCIYSSIE